MKIKIKNIVLLFLALPLVSFSQQVTNIHFEQVNKQIHIYYDLQGEGTYDISVYCSEDDGKTYDNALINITGAVGKNQKPDNNKLIIWNVLKERDKLQGVILFKVVALNIMKVNLNNGIYIYDRNCIACHWKGVAGAPSIADRDRWIQVAIKGMDILYQQAIDGYQGDYGVMPAKGTCSDCSNQDIFDAVGYMIKQSGVLSLKSINWLYDDIYSSDVKITNKIYKRTFKVDGELYDIPINKVEGFLNLYPNAQEYKSFIILNDTVDIPVKGINKFLKEYPNAQQCFFGKLPIFSIKGRFTDIRDAQSYEYVKIGKQIWMAENLAFKTSSGSWAYDNDENNVDTYGRLYDWETAIKACPKGWHLPTNYEWKQLEMALGMSQSEVDDSGFRGTDEGKKMKSTSGWSSNGNGTNSSGFNALPGGYHSTDGGFYYLGGTGSWWSATNYTSADALDRRLGYINDDVFHSISLKDNGFSVRCLRD